MDDVIAKAPPDALFTPHTDAWTLPFWQAAQREVLAIPACGECGRFRMPPGPFCPSCQSQALTWHEVAPEGILFSYTVVTRAMGPEMEGCLPYVPAVIELPQAGGVRLISNILETPLSAMRVGARAEVVWWHRPDGFSIPRFRLVEK